MGPGARSGDFSMTTMDWLPELPPLDYQWVELLEALATRAPIAWMLLAVLYAIACLGPWAKTLDVSGVIMEGDTKRPVPRAKVIITAWNHGIWDSHPTRFLLHTDDLGRFAFRRSFTFRIRRIGIAACSPSNKYAALSAGPRLLREIGKLSPSVRSYLSLPGKGHFTMEVREHAWQENEPSFQYETFRGVWGKEPEAVNTQ